MITYIFYYNLCYYGTKLSSDETFAIKFNKLKEVLNIQIVSDKITIETPAHSTRITFYLNNKQLHLSFQAFMAHEYGNDLCVKALNAEKLEVCIRARHCFNNAVLDLRVSRALWHSCCCLQSTAAPRHRLKRNTRDHCANKCLRYCLDGTKKILALLLCEPCGLYFFHLLYNCLI